MVYFISSTGKLVKVLRERNLTFLFIILSLLLNALANAQTLEQQEAIKRLVKYSYSSGAGVTDLYIEKVSKEIPEFMRNEWKLYPELRKLSYAFVAAEQANAGSGEKLLALLSQALAQDYEAIRIEPALKMYFEMVVDPGVDAIRFVIPPSGDPIILKAETRLSLLKLSKYTDQGALGSMQSILYQYYGLDDDKTFEIINSSKANLEVLEKGLYYSKVPPEHSERIRLMVIEMIKEFPYLLDYEVPKPTRIEPKTITDPSINQKVIAENAKLKRQIRDKVNKLDIVLPSQKEIFDKLYVKNEAEAIKMLKYEYGINIPKGQSLRSYIKNLERKEIGRMFTSESRTTNVVELNEKLKDVASLVERIGSNFDVLIMGEKTLRVGNCGGGATICNRCALPCVFPLCLSKRR